MKKIILITFLLFSIVSCTKKPGSFTGNIYWKYNDYVGNKPDSGSKIKLYSETDKEIKYETTTDVLGNFKIEDVQPGRYFIVIQSNNTTDSPHEHLKNLLIYSEFLKDIFGFDSTKYDKEISEINKLEDKYLDVIGESNQNKYGGLSKQIEIYDKIDSEIKDKSQNLISKFPEQFKRKLGLYTSYDKSFRFLSIEITEGKTINENIDFGTTYN